MKTLEPDPAGIAEAAALLRKGKRVALPTETVYGLAADARNSEAVAAVYAAKGRPSFNPLIVHVADLATARHYAKLTPAAERLAASFWPGPLTMVLPLITDSGIAPIVTAGLDTVAVRVPSHPVAQAVLGAFDGPVAAPSANPSGSISASSAEHVRTGLAGKIEAVLDACPCAVGLESTIVGWSDGTPVLLRPGGLTREAIEAVLEGPLQTEMVAESITAPGQLSSHYAPRAALRMNVITPLPKEVHLGYGDIQGDLTLSATGNLIEAAARLFECLHQLDATGKPIAVAPIPSDGLGAAINDRLRRAAAPRDALSTP